MNDSKILMLASRKILSFNENGKTGRMCLVGKVKNSNMDVINRHH